MFNEQNYQLSTLKTDSELSLPKRENNMFYSMFAAFSPSYTGKS